MRSTKANITCRDFRRELDDAHAPALLASAVREHAALCELCLRHWQENLALRGLLRELDSVAAPDNFDARLRSRLAAREKRRSVFANDTAIGRVPGFVWSTKHAALAACLVVALLFAGALRVSFSLVTQPVSNDLALAENSPIKINNSNVDEAASINKRESDFELIRQANISDTRTDYTARSNASAKNLKSGFGNHPRPVASSANLASKNKIKLSDAPRPLSRERELLAMRGELGVVMPKRPVALTLRGAKEALTLDAISFGSSPLSRVSAHTMASLETAQGIW